MILAVVQARMGSSRLPGKVMREVLGKPLIGYLFERLQASRRIQKVILATTTHDSDDALVRYAASHGIEVFRGSENDVLDRIYQAVKAYKPKALVRVTADSPLSDHQLIDQAIDYFLTGGFDYVSSGANPPAFPDGLDTEVFSFQALERAWKEAKLKSEREHVTAYIKKSKDLKLGDFKADQDYSDERWVVDNEEDFILIKAILENLYKPGVYFGLNEILAFKNKNPELFLINRHIQKNEGYQKSLKEDA